MKIIRNIILPLIYGAVFVLAFAPVDWRFCSFISLLALLLHSRHFNANQSFWAGYLWGVAAFGVGLSWIYIAIHDFGDAPVWLSLLLTLGGAAIMGLFTGVALWGSKRFFISRSAQLIALPACWFLMEWLRAYLLTGFPWLYVGYSQTDSVLGTLAPIGSVYLVGMAAVSIIAALVWCIESASISRPTRVSIVVLVITLCSLPFHLPRADRDLGAPIRAALLQANIAQQLRWEPEQMQHIAAQYREMSLSVLDKSDVVIWPEGAVPTLQRYLQDYFAELEQVANENHSAIIAGVFTQNEAGEVFNAAAGYGAAQGSYGKQHLVPFGEYVPFADWLRGFLTFFDLPMSALQPGLPTRSVSFRGLPVLSAICYETTYPELVRDTFLAQSSVQGAEQERAPSWMLTISNDAWYGDSFGPHQHLQIVRMRAMELGLPILRATANGLTVAIDHNGNVTARLPAHVAGILRAQIQPQQTDTLWLRLGMWSVCSFAIVLLGFAVARDRLKFTKRTPQSGHAA